MMYDPDTDAMTAALRGVYQAIAANLPDGAYVSVSASWRAGDDDPLSSVSYAVIDDRELGTDVETEPCP